MPKVFTARGSDGVVAIHEPGANIDYPTSDIGRIYFHSGLSYLTLRSSHDITINTSARRGWGDLLVHGMGRHPMFLVQRLDNNDVFTGYTVVHSSYRNNTCLSFRSTTNSIQYYCSGIGSSVNMNIPIRILIFENRVF